MEPSKFPAIQVKVTKEVADDGIPAEDSDPNADDHVFKETDVDEAMLRVQNNLKFDSSKSEGVATSDTSAERSEIGIESSLAQSKLSESAGESAELPVFERSSQSPERLLDSSTDSVPPSESSMESSQTYTSSLESSSMSPPLEESISSEKVGVYKISI